MTMLVTDSLIGLSYGCIAFTLWRLVKKIRIPFTPIVLCFGVFIGACGATHIMEVWTLWHPDYWVAACVKAITAVASVGTGIYLFRLQRPIKTFAESIAQSAGLSEQRRLDLEVLAKKLEMRVDESEEIYRATFEQAGMGIAHLSSTGQWLKINKSYCEILGYTEQELQQKTFMDVTYPDDIERDTLQLQRLAQSQASSYSLEKRYVRKDGKIVWVNLTVSVVRGSSGELRFYIASVIDITNRKQAEEERDRALLEVQRSVQTRDEFISIASHELKTPVTSMQLQLQMLDRMIKKNQVAPKLDSVAKAVVISIRQLKRLNRLVDDMLDVSRIASHRLEIRKEPVDLASVVVEVADRMSGVASNAQCEIRLSIERGVVGNWDQFRLDQVVTNLISNAVKYAPGSPIEVAVGKTERGMAILSVRDYGPGVAAEDQERIFKRFERAAIHSLSSGLGLGLYISSQIVKLHGGSIRLESEPGKGSRFIVEIPFDDEELRDHRQEIWSENEKTHPCH